MPRPPADHASPPCLPHRHHSLAAARNELRLVMGRRAAAHGAMGRRGESWRRAGEEGDVIG
ncbi:hypothetical protein U9M48_025843 [Paspalum notatum var. saurae]|uniref:Uncharacterized protein n=1 Tax=Paspalum notatum var. saurae TaxID=547442 RepID=A0AAQ3TRB1_PASNO